MKLPNPLNDKNDTIMAVIETPQSCAAKYNYDHQLDAFVLKKILPAGMQFPFHFGFIPYTKGEDGDPLDILILLDEPAWPGCIVECRVIGVIMAEEKDKKKKLRNDRFIGVASASVKYTGLEKLSKMEEYLLENIRNFFSTYANLEGKNFKIIDLKNKPVAFELIKKSLEE